VFRGFGEVLGGYSSFFFSYFVSLDGGFCVPFVFFRFLVRRFLLYTFDVFKGALRF